MSAIHIRDLADDLVRDLARSSSHATPAARALAEAIEREAVKAIEALQNNPKPCHPFRLPERGSFRNGA